MDDLVSAIDEVANGYHRLVLLVGPIASGKSERLRSVADDRGWPLVNVNAVVSERLLELDGPQRVLECKRALMDAVKDAQSDVVLLDNIEMLFEEHLQQNPFGLFQSLSRNTTLVVAWPGELDGRHLIFGDPGHRDYRKYHDPDVRIVTMQPT